MFEIHSASVIDIYLPGVLESSRFHRCGTADLPSVLHADMFDAVASPPSAAAGRDFRKQFCSRTFISLQFPVYCLFLLTERVSQIHTHTHSLTHAHTEPEGGSRGLWHTDCACLFQVPWEDPVRTAISDGQEMNQWSEAQAVIIASAALKVIWEAF